MKTKIFWGIKKAEAKTFLYLIATEHVWFMTVHSCAAKTHRHI